MNKPDLLLVGYGRFGRLAAGLLQRRFQVYFIDRRRTVRPGRGIRKASLADLGCFRIVIFALPADALKAFLERYGHRFAPGSFVADLCAVKSAPMGWMTRYLGPGVSYAGLHPLFGPDSLAADVGVPTVVVCRGRLSTICAVRLLRTLRLLGMKPLETTPAIHDKTMASTLLLTQVIGVAAASVSGRRPPFSTPGFRHLSTLMSRAEGNAGHLLRDLRRWNPYAAPAIRRFTAALSDISSALTRHPPVN